MRLKKSEYYGAALNILLTCIYVWYLFRTILKAPGHSLLSSGGDGSKNYYTYLYHILFGKGFHFEGMNYPWGEHISFTDNQPLLALPLSYLQSLFHFSINDLLLIMNLLIVVSFVVSSWILYQFFVKLRAHPFLSALFALLITFLVPNFYRVFGHFGLCYSFNVVLTFYWLFQYQKSGNKKYLFGLFLLCFFIAFIHMYNLLLSMVIIFFYAIAALLLEKDAWKKKAIVALKLVAVVLLSFISVKMVFYFTDPITDRPVSPWGILHYVTTLKHVFTSEYSSLGRTFSMLFERFSAADLDESYAYAGVVPLFYVLFVLLNGVFYFFRKTDLNLYRPISKPEKYLLIVALFSYLMAIGFPFTYGMSFLLDLMPSIKQFRSLGRISLITYFSISMACVLRLSILVNEYKARKVMQPVFYIPFLILFLWSVEIFSYSKYVQRRADEAQQNYKNFFQLHDAAEDLVVKKDTQYQCILGLPFFCIGSEKLGKNVDSEFSGDLFDLSLKTGLPIVNTLMSRSSWKQSFQLMRLPGGEFTDKEYFTKSIKPQKILLLRLKEAYMTQDELTLMTLCDSIGEKGRTVYYEMDWQKLMQYQARKIDSLNRIPVQAFQKESQLQFVNHYDDMTAPEVLFGKGALDVSHVDTLQVLNNLLQVEKSTVLEFSLWARAVSEDYRMPHCSVHLYDSAGVELSNTLVHAQYSVDNIGYWFRMSAELTIDTHVAGIRIVFRNGDDHAALYIDELLLKPVDELYVTEDLLHKRRSYNNHVISLKP